MKGFGLVRESVVRGKESERESLEEEEGEKKKKKKRSMQSESGENRAIVFLGPMESGKVGSESEVWGLS